MVDSTDLAQVLAEADDIAQSVGQQLTSAHVLLALFTVENRAQLLLKERGIDEDRLLAMMTAVPQEDEQLLRELCDRSREIARGCGSRETDSLHLLIAATRVRCAAQDLLLRSGLDLNATRNTALSYYLSGSMPRRLQLGRAPKRAEARLDGPATHRPEGPATPQVPAARPAPQAQTLEAEEARSPPRGVADQGRLGDPPPAAGRAGSPPFVAPPVPPLSSGRRQLAFVGPRRRAGSGVV